jgi:diguanylate cyclase (GGDEF)-like protein
MNTLPPPMFDPRTIIAMSGVLAVLMGGVTLYLRHLYPPSIKGLLHWAIAPSVCALSTLLYAGRGTLPDLLSSTGSNVSLLVGAALFYFGSQAFHGVAPSVRFWFGLIAGSVPVFAWFLIGHPSYEYRIVVFTTIMVAITLTHALFLLRKGRQNVFVRFTGGLLVLQAGLVLVRMVDGVAGQGSLTLLDSSGHQVTYLMAYTFCLLLSSICFILMAAERMRMEFEHLATHDSLTGALTRRAMLADCTAELQRAHRNGQGLALLMMDLDHFKAINDTHGHQAGDQVLIDFSARIRQQLRQIDRLGRYGGEEFALLLPETTGDEALRVAERVRKGRLQSDTFPQCTVSIGIATYTGENDTIDKLLARADAALYRAKALGRNRVESDDIPTQQPTTDWRASRPQHLAQAAATPR